MSVHEALIDLAAECARHRELYPKQRPTGHVTDAETSRIRTCVHEAGHAVSAVILGAGVAGVRVSGRGGETEYSASLPEQTGKVITFAGPYAEARWQAGERPWPTQISLALERNPHDRETLHLYGPGARPIAEAVCAPLVNRNWSGVMRLAGVLFDTGTADHADVCAALDVPASGNHLQLARLRRHIPGWFQIPPPPTAIGGGGPACRCHEGR